MIDLAITADHIRTTLTAYLDTHPEDKPDLTPVLDLLDTGADLTSRKEFNTLSDATLRQRIAAALR